MNKNYLKPVAFVVAASITSLCYAQSAGQRAPELGSQQVAFQKEGGVKSIRSVLENSKGNRTRQVILESFYGAEIEGNAENISELGRLAEDGGSLDERVVAIRLYASLHSPANSPAANSEIVSKLRVLSQSADRKIATAALFRYSRLPFSPDTESILDFNFTRGFLTKDDLFGEVAHILPFAPDSDQLRMLDRLDKSQNEYGLDILVSNIKDPTTRGRLSRHVKTKLLHT